MLQRMLNLSLVGMLVVLLGSSAEPLLAQAPPSGPAPGVVVDVGGHKLHIRCVGPADAVLTVILEAGAGGYSNVWSVVQEILSPRVRTCAYDRAGSGWSERGPSPRTMKQEVFELHALLEATNVPGPYLLVGHSYGGLLVRRYTEQYGKDVVGVVLVDSTHESTVLFNLREGRWMRIREQATGRAVPEPRRFAPGEPKDIGNDPAQDFWAEELQQMYMARQTDPESLGNRPLIVLAGTRPQPPPPGTSDEFWKESREEKNKQQADLARLSRNSKLVRDPSSGHNIHVDNPQLVVSAIEQVIEAASKGVLLKP